MEKSSLPYIRLAFLFALVAAACSYFVLLHYYYRTNDQLNVRYQKQGTWLFDEGKLDIPSIIGTSSSPKPTPTPTPKLSIAESRRNKNQNKNKSLSDRLRCKTAHEEQDIVENNKIDVNFFSSAVGEKFESIIPLYAFYALSSHQSLTSRAFVEIVVPDSKKFIERHNSSLAWLEDTFSIYNNVDTVGAICVRDYSHDHRKRTEWTNTWRYLEVPYQPAIYTYIGDVDIFLTESVLDERRMEQMKVFDIPYSNMVRDYNSSDPLRLTGLMLVETERFYTPALIKAQENVDARGNDEAFLYNIVVESGIGVPPSNSTHPLLRYRPSHGTHLSHNRGPNKRLCGRTNIREMLSVDLLQDFLGRDESGKQFLTSIAAKIEEQTTKKMKEVNGKCRSTLVVNKGG